MFANPFEVTKAVDFTDEQIAANWVDLPGGGFASLADPQSPMPRFLVGGKGGGRTHLLRYYSYSLQRLRHRGSILDGIRHDGYVGVYFRCGGLNSSRFAGKRQDEDTWTAVFAYYTEIWLGRLTIDVIISLYSEAAEADDHGGSEAFVDEVASLFDINIALPAEGGSPLSNLALALRGIQRNLDVAINNVALTHQLDVHIGVSPGRLVFGIPLAASRHLSFCSGLVFAYLLDEFENLTAQQQRYVNTLIREKQLPTTFLVGSRRYGLRTHVTLSAGEENRQGSEYDLVVLEDTYRAREHKYGDFCKDIVRRRLLEQGDTQARTNLDDYFDVPENLAANLEERARMYSNERPEINEARPWLAHLEQRLQELHRGPDVSALLDQVRFPDSPLHEKFAILLLYRAWADGRDLVPSARSNREGIKRLIAQQEDSQGLETTYKHYRHDLYAQLLDELGKPQEYYGLDDFIRMSGYLPRNLLVLLKQVTRWSLFLGEEPFRRTKISLKAQHEGVREASSWFLTDAKGLGRMGEDSQIAVRRLASLFRSMRFSDKPVEVSCITFETDRQGLSQAAARTLSR